MQTMGFFNTVHNVGFKDNSAFGWAERIANVCRAPRRWLAADLGIGSKEYSVTLVKDELKLGENETFRSQRLRKVVRLIVGVILSIPGEMIASSLMAAAFFSPEIRFKHKFSTYKMDDQDYEKMKQMINERQKLAKERQGCEPFSCSLVTIICLLCCLVCKA